MKWLRRIERERADDSLSLKAHQRKLRDADADSLHGDTSR